MLDEHVEGRPDIRNGLKHASVDGLLFQGAIESFSHAIGLGFLNKCVAWRDAPKLELILEMIGQILLPMVHAQMQSTSHHRPKDSREYRRDRLQRIKAIAYLALAASGSIR